MDAKAILEQIQAGTISAREGQRLLREARATAPAPAEQPAPEQPGRRRVAVVGLAARYAGARDAREFWRNLVRGECSVREVPAERWDAAAFYDPDPSVPGRMSSRWGGFVDDVDAFDPLFFNISGREAELADPQQRIFLEACWSALEDAGYATQAISGVSCGVYAGVPGSEYGAESGGDAPDAQAMMGNDSAILAARISYLLNLTGPSIALNTACSSSLVAVHLAAQAIETGQCDMALAGGVCLFLTPGFYLSATKAGMLSPGGACRTFDREADGFVPGEGVGVVVLKELEAARRDGDHVYGVLLAAETNQDGKTNGITAPSSRAQTALQLAAYRRAGISPETISVVEAHGTGTSLGDPIEVEALTRSFREYTDRTGFCAIGSVKTNIGHTGQAAGVAGLVKLLLALEHEELPPTLHFSEENERIGFAKTPFFVADRALPWPRRAGAPRRAALSSYGYSGTNAHLVIEEPPVRPAAPADGLPHLFLVSAKTPEALARKLDDLGGWLEEEGRAASLADVAFTLHAGRKHFGERAAFVAADRDELLREVARLRRDGAPARPHLRAADKRERAEALRAELSAARPGRAALERIAGLYEQGVDVDAALLFSAGRRIPMPAYPYARERYWLSGGLRSFSRVADAVSTSSTSAGSEAVPGTQPVVTASTEAVAESGSAAVAAEAVAAGVSATVTEATEPAFDHPLLAEWEGRYTFRPTGAGEFVLGHLVQGRGVLAAAASLEMARAAAQHTRGGAVTRLRDVAWRRPLAMDGAEPLEIRLEEEGGDLRFEIGRAGQPAGATGVVCAAPATSGHERIDLDAVAARCTDSRSGEWCYARLREIGLEHGEGFRTLRELRFAEDEVLGALELPGEADDALVLHPGLLDGALQAMIALAAGGGASGFHMPYALESLEIFGPLPHACRVHLQRLGETTLRIRLADEAGNVRVALDGLTVAHADAPRVLRFAPVWRPAPAAPAAAEGLVLVLDTDARAADALRQSGTPVVLAVPGDAFGRTGERDFQVNPAAPEDWQRLLDALAEQPRHVLVLWAMNEGADGVPELARGFGTLLHLGRSLMARGVRGPVSLRIAYRPGTPHLAALGAFARTLRLENPELRLSVVGLPAGPADPGLLLDGGDAAEVRYDAAGARTEKALEEVADAPAGTAFREGGVYAITGGAGGVGLLVARQLAQRGTKLLLIGRSALAPEQERELERLRAAGAAVAYERADVAEEASLARALAAGRERFGALNGVIHAAGVLGDSLILHKSAEDAHRVLAPKVAGAVLLDRLTRGDALDFVALFSSAVSVVGNVGQADYAFANAFLDEFAAGREALRRAGLRSGRTVSIGWGPWAQGMAAAAGLPHGFAALGGEDGMRALEDALAFDGPRLTVVRGDPEVLRRVFTAPEAPEMVKVDSGGEDALPLAQAYLREVLAGELRVSAGRIALHEPFESYGIDSVLVMQLTRRLEADLGELPKTLFFEHQTVGELAEWIAARRASRLPGRAEPVSSAIQDSGQEPPAPQPANEFAATTAQSPPSRTGPSAPAEAVQSPQGDFVPSLQRLQSPATEGPTPTPDERIAIVGVSGRFPMAPDLDAFWANLAEGRDCITEIPEERWPMEGFFDPRRGTPGRSYSRWGGFLDGFDSFDSLFFKVAPKEADMMDPQERVFLEAVWHLLEDAGTTRAALRTQRTGVFVGVMYGHYQLLGEGREDGRIGMSSHASIANRVSYFFDFHGPSLALDTMCSSSLTAIHLACESLRRGECQAAVAGGVNLSLHPRKYLQLSLGGFASTDGRCRSFGEGGDGYVPGEGVGALLLKPLAAALADGDTIHGIIRGSAVNHGGKTNGYTVPNPAAQADAVAGAMRRAGVRPDEIGYVEAHGTGTALGDPIEIAALTRAFGARETRCPIGSVKSSIGHLESAAGIAAIAKVLLQMRHGMLAPSLHAAELNPNVDFAASPFAVQRELAGWPRAGELPRIAGISSFGAGGSNAHVIIEEPPLLPPASTESTSQVVVLSARTGERLAELAARLADWVEARTAPADWRERLRADLLGRVAEGAGLAEGDLGGDDDLAECGIDPVALGRVAAAAGEAYGLEWAGDLAAPFATVAALAAQLAERYPDTLRALFGGGATAPQPGLDLPSLAYTLQVGREHLPERLSIVATDGAGLLRALRAAAAGHPAAPAVFRGRAEGGTDAPAGLAPEAVARAWADGAEIDWHALHAGRARRKLSLPGYPFARERHWLDPSAQLPTFDDRGTPVQDRPAAPSDLKPRLAAELAGIAAALIGLEPERLDPHTSVVDYGFESLSLKELAERISARYGVAFSPATFFERRGMQGVAEWLLEEHPERVAAAYRPEAAPAAPAVQAAPAPAAHAPNSNNQEPIAIIGMSGRFPGSRDLEGFWEALRDGRDLVTEIPAERWDWRAFDHDGLPAEERSPFRWGSFIDGVDRFEPLFFGISPAEAEMMDPQQRIFLQTVWQAIEDAGYRPSQLAGTPVGLFAGVQFHDYQHLLHEAGVLTAQSGIGNEHSILLNRISYLLDLRGPSEPVNTACSSSLVAVHRAVRSIWAGESTLAIAGGIALNLAPHSTVAAGRMGMLSPDGRCKTLDRGANGYVKGEGVGALLLKPLSRALADGDHVHAVIRGTAVNHGGRAASLTAPNSAAQAALIRTAVEEAGVEAGTIGYVELHGTGTELGDPVEINGLKSAFRQLGAGSPERPFCGIGSVKTNIGHLEPASGVAGLIKTIMAMRHRTLPGTIHIDELNPYIDLAGTPFYVVDRTRPWERPRDSAGREAPRRAGVSSFGFGGVNAHVLLEEPAAPAPAGRDETRDRLFVFSAKNEASLAAVASAMLRRIGSWEDGGPALDDVAFTLQAGREEMDERLAIVARDRAELRGALERFAAGELGGGRTAAGRAGRAMAALPAGSDPQSMAAHWVQGGVVEWEHRGRRRVPLPAYPFEGKRYWFAAPEQAPAAPRLLAAESLSGEEYVREELAAILAEKLKLEAGELGPDSALADFGVDSMLSAMIMQAVQDRFGVVVELNALMAYPTLRTLAGYVYGDCLGGVVPEGMRRGPAAAGGGAVATIGGAQVKLPPELLPINTRGTKQISFWVHGAAGYSAWFQNLSEALGPDYPVYAFQARGTDGHSVPQMLDEMVDHYVHCIRLVQPAGPYFIGGYSFGGVVAMEIARRLREEGEKIRHLVMFDTYPATQEVFDRHFGVYDEDFLQFYLANYTLKVHQNPELAIRPADVAHLPKRLQLAALAKLVQQRGNKRVSADDIYMYVRGGLACSEHAEGMYQMYQMKPYDASDVLYFRATDGFTGRASAAYWQGMRILDGYDYVQPWRDVVAGEVRVVDLDNDHLNQLEEPTLTTVAQHVEALLREPPALEAEEYAGFRASFDEVTRFGHELLAGRMVPRLPAGSFTRAELHGELGVLPGYDRLFHASVDILEREGYLRAEGGRLSAVPGREGIAPADAPARAAELAAAHPATRDYLPLLVACQAAVVEVMGGSASGTDVIFPGGSMALVAELYKGNLQTDFYNRLVAGRVQDHVRHHARRFPHSRVQLFEVGAGTGGTSAFIFDALAGHAAAVRYLYTDVGPAFLHMSRQQFGAAHPYVEFLGFDVERAPESQGFEPHSMDVVVASNVLHTTRTIAATLEQCARLLKPGGIVVINELTQRLDFNTLTFGLTEGWWLYEDEDERISGSPLLRPHDWRGALERAGFTDVEIQGVPGGDDADQAQCMIVATRRSAPAHLEVHAVDWSRAVAAA